MLPVYVGSVKDLLQIPYIQAAFSFAVLCIIMFNCYLTAGFCRRGRSPETQGLLAGMMRYLRVSDIFRRKFTSRALEQTFAQTYRSPINIASSRGCVGSISTALSRTAAGNRAYRMWRARFHRSPYFFFFQIVIKSQYYLALV